MATANRLTIGAATWGMLGSSMDLSSDRIALDASGKKIGCVFQAPYADTITHLGFRYGLRTGTPPTYRVSLQSVDGSGLPSGTVLGGGTPASATFTPPADTTWDGGWQWVALSNSYPTTRGQVLAWVVDYDSGTVGVGNNGSFTRDENSLIIPAAIRAGFPYVVTDTGSGWAKVNNTYPVWGLKSASAVYGFPPESSGATAVTTLNRRVALKFTLAAGFGDTFKVAGVRLLGLPTNGGAADFKLGLWNAAGTELQSATLDADLSVAPGSALRSFELYFQDATLATLSFGTAYYVGLEKVSAANDVDICAIQYDTAAELGATGGGAGFHESTWNGAAWVDDATRRPQVELILDDWTEPAGGGGGLIRPVGMTGGLV